ncbi:MAG: hypothetical protein KDD66_04715 [Bdellovibrionales bacterium]|nr:hypothetical protein [Bdellovibrionales bacterium]
MKISKFYALLLASSLTAGCTSKEPPAPPTAPVVTEVIAHVDENIVPSTVDDVWEEEMHNQINVPGQIDPTGTYYRPPHKTIVEIRPGRVQPVEFPNTEKTQQR